MLRFILKRLLQAIPIILATTFVAYGVIRSAPGDPVQMMVGDPSKIPASYIENLKKQMGLDKPWYISYVYWLRNLVYNPAPPPIVDLVLDPDTMRGLNRSRLTLNVDRDTDLFLKGERFRQREFAYAVYEEVEKKSGSMVRTIKVPKTISPMQDILAENRQTPFHAVFIWNKTQVLTGLFDEESANHNSVSVLHPRQRAKIVSIDPEAQSVTYELLDDQLQLKAKAGDVLTVQVDRVSAQMRRLDKRARLKDFEVGGEYLLVTTDRETSKLFALVDEASAGEIPALDQYTWEGKPLTGTEAGLFNSPVTVRAVVATPPKFFDLGESFTGKRPVTELYLEALNNTFFLVLMVLVLEFLIAVPVGIIVALKKNSVMDYVLTFLTFVGISLPNFWLALLLLMYFTYHLKWLPSGGMQSQGVTFSFSDWASMMDRLRHLALPLTVMTLGALAGTMRYTRAAVLDVIHQDYVRTARAKGLPYGRVIMRHVLKNALIPIITLIGLSLPFLISGSYIVEQIFAWPGMGKLGLTAVFERDYPVIMAGILFGSMMIIAGQLLADVLYAWANPRIRKSFES